MHDLRGATSYVVVFGGEFDPKRAQAIVERFALMLGPLADAMGLGASSGGLEGEA